MRYQRRRYRSNAEIAVEVVIAICILAAIINFIRHYWWVLLLIVIFVTVGVFVYRYWRNKQYKQNGSNQDSGKDTFTGDYSEYGTYTTDSEDDTSGSFYDNTYQDESAGRYQAKNDFMTDCEKQFFCAIKEIIPSDYVVQPQINLATIVYKANHAKYRNELFRNIDFGIFDRNYRLHLLIEINDRTHEQADRRNRDHKVKEICAEAGIPLVTFWTSYGINIQYMRSIIGQYIPVL